MADASRTGGCCRNVNCCGNTRTNTRGCARNTANCSALNLRYKQVEFALVDVILYLDAYPQCSQALEYYHRLLEEREQLVAAINEQCGPMTNLGNVSTDAWRWVEGPWPWMIEAN